LKSQRNHCSYASPNTGTFYLGPISIYQVEKTQTKDKVMYLSWQAIGSGSIQHLYF